MQGSGMSKILLCLSMVAAVLSAIVSLFKMELWLAGTQWMLVAIVFGVWSLVTKDCVCGVKKE